MHTHISDIYLHDPNFKGQRWISIGKSSRFIGHPALMVNLRLLIPTQRSAWKTKRKFKLTRVQVSIRWTCSYKKAENKLLRDWPRSERNNRFLQIRVFWINCVLSELRVHSMNVFCKNIFEKMESWDKHSRRQRRLTSIKFCLSECIFMLHRTWRDNVWKRSSLVQVLRVVSGETRKVSVYGWLVSLHANIFRRNVREMDLVLQNCH